MFKASFRIIFTFLLATPAMADFKDTPEALAKLKSYRSTFYAELRDDATNEEETKNTASPEPSETELRKIDALFDDLSAATKLLQNQKTMDEGLLAEVIRVADLSLKNDPTRFAAEVVLPAYQKNKKAFKKALDKLLSKTDASSFEKSLKDSQRELKKGNG